MKKIGLFLFLVITITLFAGCNGITKKPMDPSTITVPDDFSFSITWDCYGISSYDSKTGTLIKTWDATKPEDYITEMYLPKEELKNIYIKLTEDINLFSYTDEYNPYRRGIISTPTETIILSISANGKTKTVTCKDIAFMDEEYIKNQKAREFLRVKKEIVTTIKDTEEWKSLPDYEFGYD